MLWSQHSVFESVNQAKKHVYGPNTAAKCLRALKMLHRVTGVREAMTHRWLCEDPINVMTLKFPMTVFKSGVNDVHLNP